MLKNKRRRELGHALYTMRRAHRRLEHHSLNPEGVPRLESQLLAFTTIIEDFSTENGLYHILSGPGYPS
jgi:hypothetical protein